jgi:integrase
MLIPTPPGITLPTKKGDKDVRVAPNIVKTYRGWRAYVRHQGRLVPKRFTDAQGEQAVLDWIAGFKEQAAAHVAKQKTEKAARLGTLLADITAYLQRATVKAQPTYEDRVREMEKWIYVLPFGESLETQKKKGITPAYTPLALRPRTAITVDDLDEHLQALVNLGYSGGSVNKFRHTLQGMYTTLDGRGAANVVKGARIFPEAELLPRGRDYGLLLKILDAIPERGRGRKGEQGSAKDASQSKARIEVMLWTGLTPVQLQRLTPEHFSIDGRWFIEPRRLKGKQPRFPQPARPKFMIDDAVQAFTKFVARNCWGYFSRPSLRSLWLRAVARVEQQLRTELGDAEFNLARVRLYDIRHSVGTAVTEDHDGNLGPTREMLGHRSERTSNRYSQAAVPAVLRNAADRFAARHGRAAIEARR